MVKALGGATGAARPLAGELERTVDTMLDLASEAAGKAGEGSVGHRSSS